MGRYSKTERFIEIPDEDDELELIEDDDEEFDEEEDYAEEDEQEEEEDGGTSDSDADDDSEDEDEEDDLEKQYVEEYQTRMKAIGARFDDQGNMFFDKPATISQTEDDEYDIDGKIDKKVKSMLDKVVPGMIDSSISALTRKHPKLAPYETDVRSILGALEPTVITPEIIESYFWFIRGQKADIEIDKAVKNVSNKKTTKEAKASAAATSETPTPSKRKVKSTKIDPLVEKLSKQWGLDPAEIEKEISKKGSK